MFAFRALFAFAALAGVLANPLVPRQATNQNVAINGIVDTLDVQMHSTMPTILSLQANETENDGNIGNQISNLITAFTTAQNSLSALGVTSGSTTVFPTNDDISVTFADVMQLLATGLSGLINSTSVPSFTSLTSRLDPSAAAATTQFNATLPGSLKLVHDLMLDAKQFLQKQGTFPQTLAALGF